MCRVFQHMRPIASAMAVLLAVTAGATCLRAATQTDAQLACCEAMAHDCGSMTIESSCCVIDAQPDYAVVAVATVAPALPVAVVDDRLGSPAPATRQRTTRGLSSVKPPGVPTYLFVASFRI